MDAILHASSAKKSLHVHRNFSAVSDNFLSFLTASVIGLGGALDTSRRVTSAFPSYVIDEAGLVAKSA